MSTLEKVLNWSIGLYVAIKFFGYWKIVAAEPSLRPLFVVVPICFLVCQVILLRHRYVQQGKNLGLPFYERIETDDWFRLFVILFIGHWPLASAYKWGFFLFSGVVVLMVGFLAFSTIIDVLRKRSVSPSLIGYFLFGYFLLAWEKNMYVTHYGAPIIGHFFEKPEYDAKYFVEIEPEGSNNRVKAIADIHVEGRTAIDDTGDEDWFGMPIIRSEEFRDVWFRKLYLPEGEVITVQVQDEPLVLGENAWGIVEDSRGRLWHVHLLKEPVR